MSNCFSSLYCKMMETDDVKLQPYAELMMSVAMLDCEMNNYQSKIKCKSLMTNYCFKYVRVSILRLKQLHAFFLFLIT